MKALVFTPTSLFRLSQFAITKEWFAHYGLPEDAAGLKRVVISDIVYILEESLNNDDDPIIVINLSDKCAVFPSTCLNVPAFERLITIARSVYTTSVAIPTTWRQHREGNLFSIYASSQEKGGSARLHFETRPNGSRDLFVFARTDSIVNFEKLARPLDLHNFARQYFADAVLTSAPALAEQTRAGILLTERLPQGFVQGASLDKWYKSKLTGEQRAFVDKPYDGPVRLRGAAGTGKTLSLVIKLLRDSIRFEADGKPVKLGFLTHSLASVDLINAIGESLDTKGILLGQGLNCKIEVRTLYDLAHENLHFTLDNLQPLSLDGREGRRLQFEFIEIVLREMAHSPILTLQYSGLSPAVKSRWLDAAMQKDPRFISEIMNEFASVLDGEGIRAGEERGERYAKGTGSRPNWLMDLPSEIDRRFILEVHRRYRKILGEMNTLSVDQMIGDFNSFLDSNRWDRVRGRSGYDALFIDELHLFTSIERQTLHKLIKLTTDEDGRLKRPPIFMAYDLKQSPRDAFTHYNDADNSLFGSSTGLQNSDLVKLNQVFRYTPQIAEFLTDLDAAFPALNIPGEWEAYSGTPKLDDGNQPELAVFKDEKSLFKAVFDSAHQTARKIQGGGRRIAVLCPSEDIFDFYLKLVKGQYEGKVLPISGREPSSELRHAGKRFIFSMPEYVAGLQFETVYLIHVDASEAPADAAIGVRRRFISNVYLGSSRAEQTLKICTCLSRGGASDILDMALERKSLKPIPAW